MKYEKWEVLGKTASDPIKTLLKNRQIKGNKNIKKFFNPLYPRKLSFEDLGIKESGVLKAVKRIKLAKNKEKIFIYGDYDADGVSATAILWETLYKKKYDVMPYIPDRFKEGYGLNNQTIKDLKRQNPTLGLIIRVDNGVVAHGAIKTAKEEGIDVIVTDHHQKDKKN